LVAAALYRLIAGGYADADSATPRAPKTIPIDTSAIWRKVFIVTPQKVINVG